ncbi:MAG: SMC family ATPase [Rhodothermales bacterium]
MIPVSLKLQNFLSYGSPAEALDFEQFHVACLSGGNGQGKSALLDAITWAIWGEARKASDARKPDEDLLRIGTREMQVELVFDLEGERYRVVRSFYRTASGKTSKPGLEFQTWDAEAATFRPLTAGSISDTQAVIDTTLRLDYDTFINSAFLLQGRSDEFTKKKPGDRKEILARILGLDRYERLAAVARARLTTANERGKDAEREIERLVAALEHEDQWKTERAELEKIIADLEKERAEAQREEQTLTERVAELDALAQSVGQQRARCERIDARKRELETEREGLRARIADAEALIAQSEAIRRNHARYETLLAERQTWDDKADLQRGLDSQLGEKRIELQRQRMQAEARLTKVETELQSNRRARDEAERRLVERPAAQRGLDKALAAQREVEGLRDRRDERLRIEARLTALDKQLASERGALQATVVQVQQQVREAQALAEALPRLRERAGGLRERVAAVKALEGEQSDIREQGSGVKAELEGFERERERLQREVAAVDAKVAGLRELETETCPTCGTALTPEHRRTVEQTYADERAAIVAAIADVDRRRDEKQQHREQLLARYRDLAGQIGQANGVADAFAAVQAELATAEKADATVAEQRRRADDLDRQLRADAFRPDLRAERTELSDRLAELPFDSERFEQVQAEAAQRARFEDQLRALDELHGRMETLGRQIEQQEREAADLRQGLSAGTVFAPIQSQIDTLQRQLATVGYDGARHEAVRREIDGLKEAPERFMRLANAERNLTDWTARRTALADEIKQGDEESAGLRTAIDAAEAKLAQRAGLAERQRTHAERRSTIAASLSEAQARYGGLVERLERCTRDREQLRSVRADHREAKKAKTLYRHLRDAFGKNGIPALIIEETLPEIEERANALLERLSKGRTRVHLETLKEKKAGGTKETLDIKITDEGGVPRPYETFSGGEAFRVNFALRIALAQLLAERSGVRIRTLVVDEGFGTQDKQGIESIVEAIQVIREDFDKIVVITHLDELKEAFPVRIEVTKHPVEGSSYDVIGV